MALILDGKHISKIVKAEVAKEVSDLKNKDIFPKLAVILVGNNAASQIYVRSKERACKKAGIISDTITFSSDISENELKTKIIELNNDKSVHGILVQLPLPAGFNEESVIETISPQKDVDGFHPINFGRLSAGITENLFVPATPAGVIELLKRYDISTAGLNVVIVGRSSIVGKPLGMLFLRRGNLGDATVTIAHSKSEDLKNITKNADILIAATGRPNLITKDMIKKGAVVIDVGINRVPDKNSEKGYKITGDVDFESVSQKASAITPVPGGVGPMTIAMLLKNTIYAAKMLNKRSKR
ncbi:bifunctional methylenetetrahydrofolate dehydrogenase/methenyltetrahydrofolate cyclohydrolase FolD [bacterium]|nr:bifunctional methylenetetrahydrofolate dehydrogenase/methenyltetrahydrofolate cyclohydrolase FolD [bacterium]